jgi:hypothetical protein
MKWVLVFIYLLHIALGQSCSGIYFLTLKKDENINF